MKKRDKVSPKRQKQAGMRARGQERIEWTNATRYLFIPSNLFSAPCLSYFSHVLAPRARMKVVWCKVKLLIDVLQFAKNGFSVVFFNVPQHVAILQFALGPYRFFSGLFLLL